MYPVSRRFFAALRASHSAVFQVDAYLAGALVRPTCRSPVAASPWTATATCGGS